MAKVNRKVLDKIVRRIVKVAKPEQIIMFGSAARGEMGPDSDLDILVVAACDHRRNTARKIRRELFGIGLPIDIIVAKPEDIERYRDSLGLIYRPALREGKVLYAA
jgi:predicted nucleotidyltransferase